MLELFNQNQFNASLNSSEAFSALVSSQNPEEIVKTTINYGYPPLWNLILWVTFNLMGQNELAIRILPIILLLGVLLFVYMITSYVWGKKSGLFAVLLTMSNPLIFSSIFDNGIFILISITSLSSTYFFLKLIKEPETSAKIKVGYLLSTLLTLLSHQATIFLPIFHLIWAFLIFVAGKRGRARRIIKSSALSLLLFSPLAYFVYKKTVIVNQSFTPISELKNLIFHYLAQGKMADNLIFPLIDKPFFEVALWVTILILVFRKWHKKAIETTILVTLSLGILLFDQFISQKISVLNHLTQLIYVTPFFMIIISSGRRQISTYLITLLILIFGVIDVHYFTKTEDYKFHEYKSFLDSQQDPEIVNLIWESTPNIFYISKYYHLNNKLYLTSNSDLPFGNRDALINKGDLVEALEDVSKLGVTTNTGLDMNLLNSYKLIDTKKFGNLNYFVLTKND